MTHKEMLNHAGERLWPIVEGLHVLAIQDTSEINYQDHAEKTKDLGTVGNGKDKGFFIHPVIAVEAQEHALLGICGAEVWQRRTGKSPQYKKLPIEEKESYRWLKGGEIAKRSLATAAQVTIVGDRESDIYEEWVRIPDEKTHLLTRASRDRNIAEGGSLYGFLDALPAQHTYEVSVRARKERKSRIAKLEVGFSPVHIYRPQNCSDKTAPKSVKLFAVNVREIDPPSKNTAIEWRLLTTHTVESVEQAMQIVSWYQQRWHIEQVFRTLKSQGLDVESSEVETASALENLVVLALLASVQIMQLVQGRNGESGRPASDVFEEEEMPVLKLLQAELEGKTQAQKCSFRTGSLAWGSWIIARLGGWKGYKSERPPGPITMAYGRQCFQGIMRGVRLASMIQANQTPEKALA